VPTTETLETFVAPGIVRRGDRGLCVAGKRITLYLIMDYLKAGWPPRLLRHQLLLSEQEMNQVMSYIDSHRDEFEAEYLQVVQYNEELEHHYREQEKERKKRFTRSRQPKDAREAVILARLTALKQAGKL
jgi:uncharacterized protein (DUF433 family)